MSLRTKLGIVCFVALFGPLAFPLLLPTLSFWTLMFLAFFLIFGVGGPLGFWLNEATDESVDRAWGRMTGGRNVAFQKWKRDQYKIIRSTSKDFASYLYDKKQKDDEKVFGEFMKKAR